MRHAINRIFVKTTSIIKKKRIGNNGNEDLPKITGVADFIFVF